MEGYLAKKTTGGKWKNRYFKLENNELSWLKSDNKSTLSVNLTRGDVDVRDIKFSPARKFVFEVDAEGRTLCLAAAGEAEKEQWIIAIKKQAGLYKEKRITIVKEGGPKKLDASKVAGIANVLGLQNGTGGGMKSAQANEKLKEKLVGTALPILGAPTICKECGKTVYKVEELVINGMIFHKTCFRCAHCHRELTKTNNAYVPKEDSYYCKVHYAELFGGDALVAAVSTGKSDNPSREVDGLDERHRQQEEKEEALRREEEMRLQKAAPKETFAKEAIALREKKFGPASANEVYVESLPTKAAVEPGIIDNSATLGRPTIMAKRQQPRRKSVGKILPPEEIKDRKMHDNTFQLEDGTGTTIILHASSIFERNKWVTCMANAIFAVKLKHDLQQAQKSDMRAAIQAQLTLEAYLHDHETSYEGYMEKLSVKSQRNWKKRYFELKDDKLVYFFDEKSRKGKATIILSRFAVVKDSDGNVIEHEPAAPPPEPAKPITSDIVRTESGSSAASSSNPVIPASKPSDLDSRGHERNASSASNASKSKGPVQIKFGNASGADLANQLNPISRSTNKAFAAKGRGGNRKSVFVTEDMMNGGGSEPVDNEASSPVKSDYESEKTIVSSPGGIGSQGSIKVPISPIKSQKSQNSNALEKKQKANKCVIL